MSADIVIQKIQNCSDQEKKMSFGFCKSAGIETPYDSDQNMAKRHFLSRMSSDIFFSELSSENDASSENNKNLFPSAGTETCETDQNLSVSERRHFNSASEDGEHLKESANQDDQVYSNDTSELNVSSENNKDLFPSAGTETCDTDHNLSVSERRHFNSASEDSEHLKESANQDDKVYSNDTSESNASSENNKDLFPSAGTETCDTDYNLSVSERRHFNSASEDSKQLKESANQDDQVYLNETSESTEIEIDDANELKTQRRHFCGKTSSNIFFRGLPHQNTLH